MEAFVYGLLLFLFLVCIQLVKEKRKSHDDDDFDDLGYLEKIYNDEI